MSNCNTAFIYTEAFKDYKFSDDHPFNQIRVSATKDLLEYEKALPASNIIFPKQASESLISGIHTKNYIEAVKRADQSDTPISEYYKYGLGTEDTPIFRGMYEASATLVGGTIEAVNQVLNHHYPHALNLGGGLHHGFPEKASGFCIFNDAAIAIKYIRENYNLRVLYVDTDAHHGDGVQASFYDDPNVCTVSFHETGRYLYPGTGNTNERGVKKGFGYTFNFPLDAFTEDESFLSIFKTSMDEIMDYFRPDIIISQHGVDAHYLDPLTHLHATMNIFEEIPKHIHALSHQYCEGKWIALGGGGYDIWRVVPRAWSQLYKIMQDSTPFTGNLSSEWQKKWQSHANVVLPTTWEDDLAHYKKIPRTVEITEKNQRMVEQTLQFIRNLSI
ncbi:acetoin utilization protein AcuC [Saliterribacillus persicus]|uniref:Acetoin utilization protein AcuC n=1 Tax=Saliterribacillus persicus TaxID=930114 RepID=A0A368X404_9BACI|nr:acetoin utilization protein AcuC [Saliterribacillus persicus]RCW62653.1 acetoin utilization protein AcuC [Saliterribacillus persicus]